MGSVALSSVSHELIGVSQHELACPAVAGDFQLPACNVHCAPADQLSRRPAPAAQSAPRDSTPARPLPRSSRLWRPARWCEAAELAELLSWQAEASAAHQTLGCAMSAAVSCAGGARRQCLLQISGRQLRWGLDGPGHALQWLSCTTWSPLYRTKTLSLACWHARRGRPALLRA